MQRAVRLRQKQPHRRREGCFPESRPVILVRTDFREQAGRGPYNSMLREAATLVLDLPLAPTAHVVRSLLDALATVEARR